MPSGEIEPLIVAIDARLVGRKQTGDTTYWMGLLAGLAELETDAKFLLFSDQEMPEGLAIPANSEWIALYCDSTRWWSFVKFPVEAKKRGADVIHTQYSLSPLAGNRGITTVHDVSFFVEPKWFSTQDRMLLQKFVRLACKRAARIITVSQNSMHEIERFIPEAAGKVRAVPNARHIRIGPVPREEAIEMVRKAGIPVPFILTVGTRWARKNFELALDAVEALPASLPHKLIWTGKGDVLEEGKYMRSFGAGYVDYPMLSALYSAADLYLCPSHHEGFGIPLLEAFACGCPVITSCGGALPEVAGDAAQVMSSWKPEDWTEAIVQLLGDPNRMKELRDKGYERERQFSWRKSAEMTMRVYGEVAG